MRPFDKSKQKLLNTDKEASSSPGDNTRDCLHFPQAQLAGLLSKLSGDGSQWV